MILKLHTPSWPKKKLAQNYKKRGRKRSKISKRLYIKLFVTIYFLTKTTKDCANFVGSLLVLHFFFHLLLIFQICRVQWLKCRNLKDELNCSHNSEGVVYLLQSGAIHFSLTVPFLGVILMVILHYFIRKNYHKNSQTVTLFSSLY